MITLFTAQAEYAAGALVELCLAGGGATVRSPELARRLDVSPASMEQVMGRLLRHGLVRSARGAKGGYGLARAPSSISIKDVLEVFVPARREPRPDPPRQPTRLAVRDVVEAFEAEVMSRAARLRISDLAASARERSDVMAIMPGL